MVTIEDAAVVEAPSRRYAKLRIAAIAKSLA